MLILLLSKMNSSNMSYTECGPIGRLRTMDVSIYSQWARYDSSWRYEHLVCDSQPVSVPFQLLVARLYFFSALYNIPYHIPGCYGVKNPSSSYYYDVLYVCTIQMYSALPLATENIVLDSVGFVISERHLYTLSRVFLSLLILWYFISAPSTDPQCSPVIYQRFPAGIEVRIWQRSKYHYQGLRDQHPYRLLPSYTTHCTVTSNQYSAPFLLFDERILSLFWIEIHIVWRLSTRK